MLPPVAPFFLTTYRYALLRLSLLNIYSMRLLVSMRCFLSSSSAFATFDVINKHSVPVTKWNVLQLIVLPFTPFPLQKLPLCYGFDFSQFVVTTTDKTACKTASVKVRSLSLHTPASFTRTSNNFGASVSFTTLSVFPSLVCGSCSSGQRFAYSFFQIPPHYGHPCCSAMCFVVSYAHSGISPVRIRPYWANKTPQNLYRF